MEYKLKYPFKGLVKSQTIQSVMIRRVNAGDMMAIDYGQSEIVQMAHMIARVTGLDVTDEVPVLDLEDWQEISDIIKKQSGHKKSGEQTKQP